MDFWSLFFIVGSGATIDALAAQKDNQRSPVVVILGASFLFVILSVIGRITGKYNIAGALAIIYLIASFLDNYKQVPALATALNAQPSKKDQAIAQSVHPGGGMTGMN